MALYDAFFFQAKLWNHFDDFWVNQNVESISFFLQETRETKPEGRIMFLDLHGPPEAYSEQMKKAVSMLFPSSSSPMPLSEKKPIDVKTMMNMIPGPPKTVKAVPDLSTKGSNPQVATQKTTPSPISVQGAPATMPTVIVKPAVSQVKSPTVSGNLILQTSPMLSGVPVSILPNTPGSAVPIKVAALSSTLTPGVVPKIIHLPSTSNFINIQPKPTPQLPVTIPAAKKMPEPEAPDCLSDDHVYEDHHEPESVDCGQSSESSLPPLIPFTGASPSKEKPSGTVMKETSNIDLTKIKDQVVTKLSNMGNQFKLGDKIFGIVVRNCDSKEDIQKRLQASLASAVPLKDRGKTLSNSKERPIAPKGSVAIPVAEVPVGIVSGVKKLSKRSMDVPSAAQDPSVPFDRRNARKLSLGFMWRRTGFLVSSYQKLFTWQMPASNDNVDSAYPVLTCRVCKFEASSKNQVESHLQTHPDLQCSVCWKYFLTVGKVHEHMSVIHCLPAPSEIPKRRTYITWRLNNIRRNPLKQYQCSRCDRRFKLKDALKRHIGVCKERTVLERVIAINRAGSLLQCPTCNRSFPTADALDEHMLGHTKRTSWLCDVCGLILKSASNYRSHIARHDENAHEYKFQCSVCKKRFKLQ